MAERTKQDVSLWKYFLDALSDEIGIQLLVGYRSTSPFRRSNHEPRIPRHVEFAVCVVCVRI